MKSVMEYLTERALSTKVVELIDMPELLSAIRLQNEENVEKYLAQGANPNIMGSFGKNALMTACDAVDANLNIIKTLVAHGADINFKDAYGDTMIHLLVLNPNNLDVIKYLVSEGLKVNIENHNGVEPIVYAVRRGLVEEVKYLLEEGANPNAVDVRKNPLLHIVAIEASDTDLSNSALISMVNLLIDKGTKKTKNRDGFYPYELIYDNPEIRKYMENIK